MVARPRVWRKKRADKVIERRRVLVPWFVYGWIINVPRFVAQMRADAEWCQSEGFQEFLSRYAHRAHRADAHDVVVHTFVCKYVGLGKEECSWCGINGGYLLDITCLLVL